MFINFVVQKVFKSRGEM